MKPDIVKAEWYVFFPFAFAMDHFIQEVLENEDHQHFEYREFYIGHVKAQTDDEEDDGQRQDFQELKGALF